MMGSNEVKTPYDCIDIAIADSYDDEQIYCWIECFRDIFDGIDAVNLAGKRVAFLGFDYIDDNNLAVVYKKGKREEKAALDTIEFISPTKIQKLWIEGYNLWKSGRLYR